MGHPNDKMELFIIIIEFYRTAKSIGSNRGVQKTKRSSSDGMTSTSQDTQKKIK